MKLPNKFVTYKNSILYKLPIILNKLSICDLSIIELYDKIKSNFNNINEYIEALDCLFILNKIKLSGEILHYVERD